jgi:hypothetical protein
MRRLPHQCARHGTVDHGDASDGVFLLLHLWVIPSSWVILLANDLPPLLSSLWMASRVNGSLFCEWRRLQQLRVEGSSGARKRRPNRPLSGPGRPARPDRPRPIPARFDRPFALIGPHVFMHFAPTTCTIWRCHPHVQDGGSPCMKFNLLRFNPRGWSFVTLRSLLPLGVISSSS